MAAHGTNGAGHSPLGLTAEQEARARRLHADSVVCDLMFMGPLGRRAFDALLADEGIELDLERPIGELATEAFMLPMHHAVDADDAPLRDAFAASGVDLSTRQLDGMDLAGLPASVGVAQAMFDRLSWLAKALDADDVRAAKQGGRHAALVNLQHAGWIGTWIELLDAAAHFGVRMVGLTYNGRNEIGWSTPSRTRA